MKRNEIASISVILDIALEENNKNALNILDETSEEVSLIIDTIYKKLDFDTLVKVSFSGSVANIGERLMGSIKNKVEGDIDIVTPYASPVEGSIILAKKLYKESERVIWIDKK